MNIALVEGTLLETPSRLVLSEGREVVTGTIIVLNGDRRESVPFSWFDGPSRLERLDGGCAVFAMGRVTRRFFRSGGRTESRTDLVVSFLDRSGRRRRIASGLAPILTTLAERIDT